MRTIIIGKHLSEISLIGQINYVQFLDLDCQRVIVIARIVCRKKCPNSKIDRVTFKKVPPYEQKCDKDNQYFEEGLLLTFGD